MTGLDLESFLLLLRADLSAWVVLGLAIVGLALLVWLCWGSRRALRKCLVLSLSAHLVLVLYGSTVPTIRLAVSGERPESSDRSHIRRIQVSPMVESGKPAAEVTSRARGGDTTPSAGGSLSSSRLELAAAPLRLADIALSAPRPEFADRAAPDPPTNSPAPLPIGAAIPRPSLPVPERPTIDSRPDTNPSPAAVGPVPPSPLPPNLAEGDRESADPPAEASPATRDGRRLVAEALGNRDMTLRADVRLRPGRTDPPSRGIEPGRTAPSGSPAVTPSAPDSVPVEGPVAPGTGSGSVDAMPKTGSPARAVTGVDRTLSLDRVTPRPRPTPGSGSGLASLDERPIGRTLAEIPKVYQPRVDPDRPNRAQRDGASAASELAVERALDWLARHQDPDGRWDAATARYDDGTPSQGGG